MSALVQPAAAGPAGRTRPRGATIPMRALVQPDSWAHVRNQSWSVIAPHDGRSLGCPAESSPLVKRTLPLPPRPDLGGADSGGSLAFSRRRSALLLRCRPRRSRSHSGRGAGSRTHPPAASGSAAAAVARRRCLRSPAPGELILCRPTPRRRAAGAAFEFSIHRRAVPAETPRHIIHAQTGCAHRLGPGALVGAEPLCHTGKPPPVRMPTGQPAIMADLSHPPVEGARILPGQEALPVDAPTRQPPTAPVGSG